MFERAPRQLGDLAGELHPRRARADHREREPLVSALELAVELGHLKRAEDPPSEFERVVDRLHSWGVDRELVVAEVGLAGSGSHDQTVVGDPRAAAERVNPNLPLAQRDVLDIAEYHPRVPEPSDYVTDRRCDVALRENAGGDLVKQRLEEVMVGAVHDCDIHRRSTQCTGSEQPAEPGPDDDDAMFLLTHRSDALRRRGD